MTLKKKTIKGVFWSFGSQFGRQTSQFIITAILARLLLPSDFGLVSMVTVFTGFVSIFGEMGITNALIQKQDTHDGHYYSAFWLNVFVGAGLTVAFWAIAPLIAYFYKRQELIPILKAVSINFIISSFAIIQQSILMKNMDFKKIMVRDLTAVILSGILGIFLALHGLGVWSLVTQLIVYTLLNTLLLWILSGWRPRLHFSRSDIKDIWSFSANMAGANFVNYIARNVDSLLIGRFLGAQALGYYSLAYKLMMIPVQNITWAIGKVLFPVFSKMQEDLNRLKSAYLKIVDLISFISFPAMVWLFIFAPEFVRLVYGSKWVDIVALIRILCFCGMLQSVYLTVTNITLSMGRADLHFYIGILNLIGVSLFVSIGLNWGIYGVAIMYLIEQVFCAFFFQYVTNTLIKLKWKDLLQVIIRNLSVVIFTAIGVVFIKLIPGLNDVKIILFSFMMWAVLYIIVAHFFDRNIVSKYADTIFG